MERARTSRIAAGITAATGLGIVLLAVPEISRLHNVVFTMDMPDEAVRLNELVALVRSLFGAANIVFGWAIWRGRSWGRRGLAMWAVLWSALFALGTLAKVVFLDLRLASFPFLCFLGLSFMCTGWLFWALRRFGPEAQS